MSIKLQEPITNGSLKVTNFFNGRLITGADLTREQTARAEADRRLGMAIGSGIVEGLTVEKASLLGKSMVKVSAGLAVNLCGQTLYLKQEETIDLQQRFSAVESASKLFVPCQNQPQTGEYVASHRLYLLVLSPAEITEGSAPTSGLNNAFASCNRDLILETVQFRLLPIDPFLSIPSIPTDETLRNYVAYKFFGIDEMKSFYKNPLGFSLESYGLIDKMRKSSLSKNDVPLAVINWTATGIKFVDIWAVRRSLDRPNLTENRLEFLNERRVFETKSMMSQFANQIEDIEAERGNLQNIEATDYFNYLPPAGLLPIDEVSGSSSGFDVDKFFGAKRSKEIYTIDGDVLRVLLNQASLHEPIEMKTTDKIQLYYVRENQKARETDSNIRQVIVFARHSLPFFGVARFDEALWEKDTFSEKF